jgi:predicted amidohydrolase
MRCVLLQAEPVWQDLPASRERLAAMLAEAGPVRGAMVITPELAESGFTMHPDRCCDEASVAFAASLSRAHGCHLQHGFVERAGGGFRNVVAVFGPDGRELGRYAKNHLFSPAGEPRAYAAGDAVSLVRVGPFRMAPLICYDLRFPELWRLAAVAGAGVFALSACWPQVRQAHWRALVIARAIENQAFVLACNRVGHEPNATYTGGSLVVAPDGEVLAEAENHAAPLIAELDAERLRAWRERFPALRDMRRERLGSVSTQMFGETAESR